MVSNNHTFDWHCLKIYSLFISKFFSHNVVSLTDAHSFSTTARDQYEVLEGMQSKMTSLYIYMGKYFSFEPNSYDMERFFSDINTFANQFKVDYRRFVYLM